MKITPEHVAQFCAALTEYKNINHIDLNKEAQIYKNGALTPMRFRFDVMYALPFSFRRDWYDNVYKYCNDDHINTMLKKFVCDDEWNVKQ